MENCFTEREAGTESPWGPDGPGGHTRDRSPATRATTGDRNGLELSPRTNEHPHPVISNKNMEKVSRPPQQDIRQQVSRVGRSTEKGKRIR